MKFSHVRTIAFCLAACLPLAACGDKGDKATTQVAAKVNGDEISVHQINFVLQHSKVAPEQSKAAAGQILNSLVDQQVVLQKANEKKLDRDPQIMQQIEAAKREILERAYLEQATADVAKPTDQEISDYYTNHPELFSDRRIYNYRVFAIQASRDKFPAIQEQVAKAKTLDDLVPWLKGQSLPVSDATATRPAEQIPAEVRPKFHQMKDGQIGAIADANGIELVQLLSSTPQVIDEAHARPAIEQFLTTQRRTERVKQIVQDLRANAKIEFVGEFAKTGSNPAPTNEAPVVAPAAAASTPATTDIEKGIAAGIK